MADTSPAKDKEIAELRQQLNEAQETLRAITSGEIDAVVVRAQAGEKIYTLQGADTIYRTAIENINEGILSLSPEGIILYANGYFSNMMKVELNRIMGMSIFDFITPICKSLLASLLEMESGRDEITLVAPDNTKIPAFIAVNRLQLETSDTVLAVVTDLTQQKRNEEVMRRREYLEKLVAERTQELRDLAHRLVDAQEKERAVIGSALHDEIGQLLTYTTLLIDRAARKQDPKILVETKSIIQDAISRIRDLSSMLSPKLLRSAGLSQALTSLVEDYTRRTKIKVDFSHSEGLDGISEEVSLACYRILQESLTNTIRHAKATEVKVLLSCDHDSMRLEVVDNGIGFEPEMMKKATGLTGMRERALALGGDFFIESGPGKGTQIIAKIPLSERKQE